MYFFVLLPVLRTYLLLCLYHVLVEFERNKFPTFDPDTDPTKPDPDPQHCMRVCRYNCWCAKFEP
jgi:hypothetical protein